MNLRELLLQFAGENEESLKLDELLSNNIKGIKIEKDISNGVKILIEDSSHIRQIKQSIFNLLEKAGYEDFRITPQSEGTIQHIIVEVN